jgi:hypothetical protein
MKLSRTTLLLVALTHPVSAVSQQTWTVGTQPVLDIIGADSRGKVNFALPAGATRLSDGSLLVADRGGGSVLLFDRSGTLIRTSGRAGEGPGEFQSMLWAGGCGTDSLLVWDARLRRATFVGKGGILRQFNLPATPSTPNGLWFSCGSGGTIAYLSEPTGRRAPIAANIIQMEANVVALTREGELAKNHGLFSGGEWFLPGRGGFPRPLGAATSIAMVGNSIVVGTADSASIVVIATDGKRTTLAVPGERRAPTREEFDASVRAIGSLAPGSVRQMAIDGLSKAPMPPLLPPYSSIFPDQTGLVWVQLSPTGSRQSDFIAMQLDGRVLARIRIPRPLTIYEIGRDYVLGSFTDDQDEVHIVIYRLTR